MPFASPNSPSPRARAGLYGALRRTLSRPGADRAVIALSLLLLAFSLDTGLAADDYIHLLMARDGGEVPGFRRAPWDLFRFADGGSTRQLMRDGIFLWWDDPEARVMFLRPIASLSHYLDYTLWPTQAWLMRLQSIAWAALLYAGLLRVYRALLGPAPGESDTRAAGFVTALAMFLYALDDARGWFVSWVAARNAVIGTAFSVWALWLHHVGRMPHGRGPRAARVTAPALLLLSLLSNEGAVAICGYLFAYALFIDRGPLWLRARSLVSYGVVVVVWRLAYRASGYGAARSGLYFDPLGDPVRLAEAFAQRGPVLLFAQLGGMWSDAWSGLFAFPQLTRWLVVLSAFSVVVVGYALWPLLRRDASVRFGVTGALLSLVPASAAFSPADRLLSWVAIGASIALAKLIATYFDAPEQLEDSALRAMLLPPMVLALVVSNAIIAPPFLASRSRGNEVMRGILDRAHASVPSDPSIRDKRVVYVNPAAVPLVTYIAVERAAQGIPRPEEQLGLATADTELRVERVDARSLRLRQRGGFLVGLTTHLLRDPTRRFEQDHVQLSFARIEISERTDDGRPSEIVAHFDRALEDPSFVWLQWGTVGYRPFTPPAIGESVTLPAADTLRTVLGDGLRLPFDGRLPAPADPHFRQ